MNDQESKAYEGYKVAVAELAEAEKALAAVQEKFRTALQALNQAALAK